MKRVCEAASFLRLLTRNAERTFLVKQLIHKIIVSLPPYMYCIKYRGQTFYTLRLVSLWFQCYRNLLLVITTQHLHCHLSIRMVWYQTGTIIMIHCLTFLLKSLKVLHDRKTQEQVFKEYLSQYNCTTTTKTRYCFNTFSH